MVDRTGADVQTNHEYVQGPTARKAAQAEPAILPQLVTSIIKQSTNHRINQAPRKKQESKTLTTTTTHQTTAPLHPSVSTQFLPYIPTFLQLPLVSVTRLHYQKVPTSAIWIPTPSCLCVSFCKHCSQSAASSGSATAACTVSALTFSDRNDVDELNFQGRTVKISSTGKH